MTTETGDLAAVDIDIYDGAERVAFFHHRDIPFAPADAGILQAVRRPIGADTSLGLNNGYFWSSAKDLRLHANLVSRAVGAEASLFPEQLLRDFLARALER